jgi:nitrate reductase NapE component
MEKEIDRILNEIKDKIDFIPESCLNFNTIQESDLYQKTFTFLTNRGFIKKNEVNNFTISENGIKVIESGGWNNYHNLLNKHNKQRIKKDQIDYKKSMNDLILKKFQVITFWPIFIFAFVGFGFSVYNFVINQSSIQILEHQKNINEQLQLEVRDFITERKENKYLDSVIKFKTELK